MAQRGRPRKTDSRPKAPSDKRTEYYCSRCGRAYPQQRGNFSYSQSSLYDGNNHYLTICTTCVDELYDHYVDTLGSEQAAMRRICSKLDIYYKPELFGDTKQPSDDVSRIGQYVSRLALRQYKGKTYDTTLDEEHVEDPEVKSSVRQKTKKFFGAGFSDEDYTYLQEQYDDWISRYECQSKAQEEIFKDLAFAQLNQVKAQREGDLKRVNEAMEAKQKAIQRQGISPIQRNDSTFTEQQTFGTWIEKFENTRPIPQPDPEWEDVDGIKHFILVYFIGHICKMFGLQNRYSEVYEREMSRYRVEHEEEEENEDGETGFDAYFDAYKDQA